MNYFFRIFFLLILALNQQVFSQQKDSIPVTQNRLLTERLVLNTGVFISSKKVKVGVNGGSNLDIIDFNKTFDINQYETTFSLNLFWRFSRNKKWSLGLEYFGVNSSKELIIDEEINWGDNTYPIGARMNVGFGFELYRLFLGRVISRGEKHELLGGLGLHAMDIKSYLQAMAYLGEEGIEIDLERKNVSVLAPVPNIGFKYLYAPSTKWALGARVDWFSLSTGGYSGYLWNIAPSVTYLPFKNVGVGVSYRYFDTSLKVNKTNWDGTVKFLYHGPVFYLSVNF